VALTAACCLLVSCSSAGPEADDAPRTPASSPTAAVRPDGREPGPTTSPSTSPPRRPALPAVPARQAPALAGQLDRAAATVRDPDARPADVRRAGELQQLAARDLAEAPPRFRARVTDRLRPATARATRNDVRAARLLHGMSAPAPRLPRWRIVAPPPPAELLRLYRRAERRTGVPWEYLAAINLVETRMGRIDGVSTAGARGPMQFLPSTWAIYGAGGDIEDPRDAIPAAARLLVRHGAPDDMAGALWHYNPSDRYVGAVTAYARNMQRSPDAYAGYWHWRVLYHHVRGVRVLPVGYPKRPAQPLAGR
jgi:membrane-bound lytic murein transglycosylase B